MDENEIKENAAEYVKDSIASVNDAFKWIFMAKDYDDAYLVFEALESLKIAFENLSGSARVWNNNSTKAETIDELKKATEQIEIALVLLQRS